MTIAITGVTGFLGGHLLFEIIKQNLSSLKGLKFFLFGRDSTNASLKERMITIFESSGYTYIGPNEEQKITLAQFLVQNITYIPFNLGKPLTTKNNESLQVFKETPIDFFFHLAALTDIRSTKKTERLVMQSNYLGTKYLMDFIATCQVKEFDFVGTAFLVGKRAGKIHPDDQPNKALGFNNPYERSKVLAEKEVRLFAQKTKTKCRYFRPSIICGRLMESTKGYIPKFDVFYQIFAFLFLEKLRLMRGDIAAVKNQPAYIDLRAIYKPNGTINIVPVDYAVKLMYAICIHNIEGDSFHLVNEKNACFKDFLSVARSVMKFQGITAVDKIPSNMNFVERFYYQKIGSLFQCYLTGELKLFNTSNTRTLCKEIGLACPEIHKKNIESLLSYATNKHYGLNIARVQKKLKILQNFGSVGLYMFKLARKVRYFVP